MGDYEGWAQPNGHLPNGLLPNEAASVTRVLHPGRWSKAEERTAELIGCIQPNKLSQERRNAVAVYVQRLISQCFSCQVFTFGSVPLKTYLPDGDIDLTVFSKNESLKDTWANMVRDMLEKEEKSGTAEFRVKEVQYIQAEVKIIKCLVENIVVDISFNQLGGLCTLCFLEEVDHLINQNHLFKRSIILIKTWCYYESRILGAHHGLISTYALETLVLYIFHVYNNSFSGPLEVLYRFLEFFSNFDWDNFCVSLWGPVPISSLPDMTAEPPRKDSRELLLSKLFLDACGSVYAVFPGGQENHGPPFVSKNINIVDPLRTNNNLGRSVNKGNFFRIRSAFAFGAKRLARLLDCRKEDLIGEVDQFFMNTWERHGSGHRPDAASSWSLHLLNPDHFNASDKLKNDSINKKKMEVSGHESEVERFDSFHDTSYQQPNHLAESISQTTNMPHTQSQKIYASRIRSQVSEQLPRNINSSDGLHAEKAQRRFRPDHLTNEVQGRFQFGRTHSSPELTNTSNDVSRVRHNRVNEIGKRQTTSSRPDYSRRKNSGVLGTHTARSSNADSSSMKHSSSNQSLESAGDSNTYQDGPGFGPFGVELASVAESMEMHQEEQDLVNMMASSRLQGFSGQSQMQTQHLPLQPSHPFLASVGYAQKNLVGMIPPNIPLVEPSWSSNLLPQELKQVERDHSSWKDQDASSTGINSGGFQTLQSDAKQQSTSRYKVVPLTPVSRSDNSYIKNQHKFSNEIRGPLSTDNDTSQYQHERGNDVFSTNRDVSLRSSSSTSLPTSSRSKASSESSWDGSSVKLSKSTRDKRGMKTGASADSPPVYGKVKGGQHYDVSSVDNGSSQTDDDNRDWTLISVADTEIAEGKTGSKSAALPHVQIHKAPNYEAVQMSGPDSMISNALVGSGSRQRMDNSGVLPVAFYLPGTTVPYVTMLPVYNLPSEKRNPQGSASNLDGKERLDNSFADQSDRNFDLSDSLEQSEILSSSNSKGEATSMEPPEVHKSDILNGDFSIHWQNLQYGRFCQNPSPVMVPPGYLQGHFQWEGPGRPISANGNIFSQLADYGPRPNPVVPLQANSNRPNGTYRRHGEELPRYRAGTGTYLPNRKVPFGERQSASIRNHKGSYSYDRNDHHNDREGNWNYNSRERAANRSHNNRSQSDRLISRSDRLAATDNQTDRPWETYRHDSFPSHPSQNGSVRSPNSRRSSTANMTYNMHPLANMNSNGVAPNGPSVPSIFMMYSYDPNHGYGTPAEQLEFGSLKPAHYSGTSEVSQLSEGDPETVVYEQQEFQVGSPSNSSPDQPSSPQLQRSTVQRNYQLQEDLPTVVSKSRR